MQIDEQELYLTVFTPDLHDGSIQRLAMLNERDGSKVRS